MWPADQTAAEHDECQRVPYYCRSWRHEGKCRQWRGSLDWWRVREGIKTRSDWVYIVLTYRQPADDYGRWKTYLQAGVTWNRLRTIWTRRYGKMAYVQTWERHQAGGCHCNLLVGNSDIASSVEIDWQRWRRDRLEPDAVRAGFGERTWVERCDEKSGAIAGYLTKLARELTGADAKSQVPADAPPHFRRLRASRGLLPPVPHSDLAGELVRCPLPEYTGSTRPGSRLCGAVGSPGHNHTDIGVSIETGKGDLAEASGPVGS